MRIGGSHLLFGPAGEAVKYCNVPPSCGLGIRIACHTRLHSVLPVVRSVPRLASASSPDALAVFTSAPALARASAAFDKHRPYQALPSLSDAEGCDGARRIL